MLHREKCDGGGGGVRPTNYTLVLEHACHSAILHSIWKSVTAGGGARRPTLVAMVTHDSPIVTQQTVPEK